jgi:hypothetical protein
MHLCVCVNEGCGDGVVRNINLTVLSTGLVTLRGPIHLCVCVSEEGVDGEGADSQALSDTLGYINLTRLTIGLVTLCGLMHLCVCVSEDRGEYWYTCYSTVKCTIVKRSCRILRVCIFCENV